MTAEIASILRRAADLIEPEGAWTQGVFARDEDGERVPESSPSAVSFCMHGAICRCDGGHPGGVEAVNRVIAPDYRWISEFNDAPERTQAEVVAKLREAADLAEQQP